MRALLATVVSCLVAGSAFADTPALPKWELLPRTAVSVPLGTVVFDGAPSLKAVPKVNAVALSDHRYVEEEYVISGTANVYAPEGETVDFLKPFGFGRGRAVAKSNVPYTTRILVRRPVDAAKFSGTVQLEPIRDITESTTTWRRTWPYLASHGDIWVGVTVSKANLASLHRKANPIRYARLDLADEGQRWDILAQVAWLLRSREGLLEALGFLDVAAAKPGLFRLYSSGWSLTGCMQSEYLQKGRHEQWRRPDGKPLMDGYLIGICPFGGQVPVPKDAAVIQMMSESEYTGPQELVKWVVSAQQPDANAPGERRYRWYDVAGSAHADFGDQLQYAVSLVQAGAVGPDTIKCAKPITRLPGADHFARAALRNLEEWVRIGRYPPPGKVFALNDDATITRDAAGNALGGLRPHWMEVPAATFVPFTKPDPSMAPDPITHTVDGFCALLGHEEPFAKEQLAKLYKDHAGYVDKVTDVVVNLVNTRQMLAADADAEIAAASKALVP